MVQTMKDVALEFNRRYVKAIKNGKNVKGKKVFRAIVKSLFNEYGGIMGYQNSFYAFEGQLIKEKNNLKKKETNPVVIVKPESNLSHEEFQKNENDDPDAPPNEGSRTFIEKQINLYDLNPDNY